jgi:hypothetical protein
MDDEEKPRQYWKGDDFYNEEGKGFKVINIWGADFDLSIGVRHAPESGASSCFYLSNNRN